MINAIVMDMDGTVANSDHRLHWIKTKPKNWKAFNAGWEGDTPHEDIILLWRMFASNPEWAVLVATARPESERETTALWLARQGLFPQRIYMRKNNDYRPDYDAKKEMVPQIIADGYDPIFVFDDRDSAVKAWREMGLRCLQVSYGDY